MSLAKADPVLTSNDPRGDSSLLQFAFEEFQLLLSEKWIRFVEGISHALVGRIQDEAACVLKGKGFEASPLLEKFLDGDMSTAAIDQRTQRNALGHIESYCRKCILCSG